MKSLVALSFVVLATSVFASPVTIPLTKLQRSGTYLKGSSDADRARAAFLSQWTGHCPNLAYSQYATGVGIGSPPTYYNLIVDTGSSNTFCGTGRSYVRTKTSIFIEQDVNVTYGVGYISGLGYLDQVTLAPNLVITNQLIGDALSFADFEGVDGIIGVGPADLTQGTLLPDVNATIATVMNNLVSQGLIINNDTNGALTYGGADPNLYEGEVTYTPVTETLPAGYYWGINVTLVTYGTHTIIPTSTAGIVDTGTTQVLLPDDFFDVYMKAILGATFDLNIGLIEIPTSSIAHMWSLNFLIAGREFNMDVASQLIPIDQNAAWGAPAGKQYGVVCNTGSNSGLGLDFTIGQKFMERYYAVFDADPNRVGFAETNNTFSTIEA